MEPGSRNQKGFAGYRYAEFKKTIGIWQKDETRKDGVVV
jgi:hypothetical protein